MATCPLYTTVESVKVRLANKVQFQSDPEKLEEGELPNQLLLQLVSDAETSVENDLCGRYAIPFKAKYSPFTFDALYDHTKRILRMVVDIKAVMMILDTDFGAGTHIDPSKYYANLQTRYDNEIAKILGRDQEAESKGRFRFTPPLDGLMLAASNAAADDGFKGMLINTDGRPDSSTFAETQINDPAVGVFGFSRRFF